MKRKLFIANWKMHKTIPEASSFFVELQKLFPKSLNSEVVLCPPFTALSEISSLLKKERTGWKLGAQDMFWETQGAYTGEISPRMLQDLGCEYVLVAHSERRKYFGETDETANRKVLAAFSQGLTPVLCVGETLKEMENGETKKVLSRQIGKGLHGLKVHDFKKLVFAYEPVWAIGTGKADSPSKSNETVQFLRETLDQIAGCRVSENVRILYGGSVTPQNISGFMEQPDLDGALVGGASLDPKSFSEIVDCSS